MTNTNITVRANLENMVNAYQQAVTTLRESFATMYESEKRLNAVFNTTGTYRTICAEDGWSNYRIDWKDADQVVKRMQRQAWRVIVMHLELKAVLSVAAWKQLESHLEHGDLPEITIEMVAAFADKYASSLPELFEAAVQEVFARLRPRSSYKTNSEYEIGSKVILRMLVDPKWCIRHFRVNNYYSPHLIALENVFQMLDGKGQRAKGYISQLEHAIQETPMQKGDGRGETEYFKFRCHKNQNVHLEFKRMDLVARLNQIAGGARLRSASKAA